MTAVVHDQPLTVVSTVVYNSYGAHLFTAECHISVNTLKKREQNLFVCSSKSEAKVTIIEDCTRHSVLLKLTTDRHETSHGLSATARLLVEYVGRGNVLCSRITAIMCVCINFTMS